MADDSTASDRRLRTVAAVGLAGVVAWLLPWTLLGSVAFAASLWIAAWVLGPLSWWSRGPGRVVGGVVLVIAVGQSKGVWSAIEDGIDRLDAIGLIATVALGTMWPGVAAVLVA